jgi:hypothetical protein
MAPAKKVVTPEVQAKYYNVLVDAILGGVNGDAEARPEQYRILKGQVSGADLVAAGADIEWLLRSGQIEELGWAPA